MKNIFLKQKLENLLFKDTKSLKFRDKEAKELINTSIKSFDNSIIAKENLEISFKIAKNFKSEKLNKFFLFCFERFDKNTKSYEEVKKIFDKIDDLTLKIDYNLLLFKKEKHCDLNFLKKNLKNDAILKKKRDKIEKIIKSCKTFELSFFYGLDIPFCIEFNNLPKIFKLKEESFTSEIIIILNLLKTFKINLALEKIYTLYAKTNKTDFLNFYCFIKLLNGDFFGVIRILKACLSKKLDLMSKNINSDQLKGKILCLYEKIFYLERLAGIEGTSNKNAINLVYTGEIATKNLVLDEICEKSNIFCKNLEKSFNFEIKSLDLFYNFRIFRKFIVNKHDNLIFNSLFSFNRTKVRFSDSNFLERKVFEKLIDFDIFSITKEDSNIILTNLKSKKETLLNVNHQELSSIVFRKRSNKQKCLWLKNLEEDDEKILDLFNFELKNEIFEKSKILFIYEPETSYLPLEYIFSGTYSCKSFFRIPSSEYLLKPDNCEIYEKKNILCIIDDNVNLYQTHMRIKPFLKQKNIVYYNNINKLKDKYFGNFDTLIYFGHNNGEYLINFSKNSQSLKNIKFVFLFGCSSAKITPNGIFRPESIIYKYFINCNFLVGCLWDVTDYDLDIASIYILDNWLKGESIENCVRNSRNKCRLKGFNGSSIVLYGY